MLYAATALTLMTHIASASDVVLRANMVYPVTAPPIENGVILITDGKIAAIGPEQDVPVPPDAEIIEASVALPGLVDAHSVAGLSGYLNQPHDQDHVDDSEPLQPELRAVDAYNFREPLVSWLRGFGVTTLHTGHGPGALISGQTMTVKTSGSSNDVLVPKSMISVTLGSGALSSSDDDGSPGTRSKAVAMLRQALLDARTYIEQQERASESDDPPARDLRLESLAGVIAGETPLLVTAHRHNDISSALRIATEFDIRVVLDGAAECYLVLDEIQAAGVPVILHPTMLRPTGERKNVSFTTAGRLAERGIQFAIQSGYEPYVPRTRVVLFEAALATAYGLSFDDALSAITIVPARILGIEHRIGSLEVGKDADIALYDGNPFEYSSHAVGTVIDGVYYSPDSGRQPVR